MTTQPLLERSLRFLSRFRVSMLELILVLTGLCLGLTFLIEANDFTVMAVQALQMVVVVATIAIGLAIPDRRMTLLSFASGVLVFQYYDFVTVEFGQYSPEENLVRWLIAQIWNDRWAPRTAHAKAFTNIALVEISIVVGICSAWLTRSLQRRS